MSSRIIVGKKTPDKKSGVLVKIDLTSVIIVPFFDGVPIKENVIRVDVSGKEITSTNKYSITNNRVVNEKETECAIGDGIRNAVRDCHVDIRRDLYDNILITGENKKSKEEQFAKDLNTELRKIIPRSVDITIRLIETFEALKNWTI